MEERFERYHPDMEALHRGFREKPCFVCEVAAGTNDRPQHFVHEDERFVAFLDSYPRAHGYTLVAPKEHREQVTADFSPSRSTSKFSASSIAWPKPYARKSARSGCIYLHLRFQPGKRARPLARRAAAARRAV